MRHSISLTCVRYRLRPVKLEDAPFIVSLRADPLLNRFVHATSPRVEDQVSWLQRYFERDGDYYFIVENAQSSEAQGTVGLYNVKSDNAEWGRWIVRQSSIAALESAWLISEIAFLKLTLGELYSRTLSGNRTAISFHDSFGASRVAASLEDVMVRGERHSVIEHRITALQWPAIRARHYSTITRLAPRAPSNWRGVPA